jgi:hypothetical protein
VSVRVLAVTLYWGSCACVGLGAGWYADPARHIFWLPGASLGVALSGFLFAPVAFVAAAVLAIVFKQDGRRWAFAGPTPVWLGAPALILGWITGAAMTHFAGEVPAF